jgi:hypothetical protein
MVLQASQEGKWKNFGAEPLSQWKTWTRRQRSLLEIPARYRQRLLNRLIGVAFSWPLHVVSHRKLFAAIARRATLHFAYVELGNTRSLWNEKLFLSTGKIF